MVDNFNLLTLAAADPGFTTEVGVSLLKSLFLLIFLKNCTKSRKVELITFYHVCMLNPPPPPTHTIQLLIPIQLVFTSIHTQNNWYLPPNPEYNSYSHINPPIFIAVISINPLVAFLPHAAKLEICTWLSRLYRCERHSFLLEVASVRGALAIRT